MVTTREWSGTMVGNLEPRGRDLSVSKESFMGDTWRRSRSREGWPDLTKAWSAGAKTVAVGESCLMASEAILRVKDMDR